MIFRRDDTFSNVIEMLRRKSLIKSLREATTIDNIIIKDVKSDNSSENLPVKIEKDL